MWLVANWELGLPATAQFHKREAYRTLLTLEKIKIQHLMYGFYHFHAILNAYHFHAILKLTSVDATYRKVGKVADSKGGGKGHITESLVI